MKVYHIPYVLSHDFIHAIKQYLAELSFTDLSEKDS